jgi:hypothetical protein
MQNSLKSIFGVFSFKISIFEIFSFGVFAFEIFLFEILSCSQLNDPARATRLGEFTLSSVLENTEVAEIFRPLLFHE